MQFIDGSPRPLAESGSRGNATERAALKDNPLRWAVISTIPKPADSAATDMQKKERTKAMSRCTTIKSGRGGWAAPEGGSWDAVAQISADGSKYEILVRFVPTFVPTPGAVEPTFVPTVEPTVEQLPEKSTARRARGAA